MDNFALLDDSDVICAIKVWANHSDVVLSALCRDFTNRKLFKVETQSEIVSKEKQNEYIKQYMSHFGVSEYEAQYFMGDEVVSTDTYSPEDDNINILLKNGTEKDVADVSDMLNIHVLTKKVEKHFFCYYRL